MQLSLVERLASQLRSFAHLKQIYLNGYDEPTLNPYLVDSIRILGSVGAKIMLLTNGTRLTVELAERIVEAGTSIEIDIHLSAADPDGYREVHQSPLYASIMSNLDDLASSPIARQVALHIGMQLAEDADGDRAYASMIDRFADTAFQVARYVPNDRAGLVPMGIRPALIGKLGGCALQERTDRWLHVSASGNVVLCCQDYLEEYVVGDAAQSTLDDILRSPERKRFHAWTTGGSEPPGEYICRRCSHAITAS